LLLEHLASLVALPPESGCVSWFLVCVALCCGVVVYCWSQCGAGLFVLQVGSSSSNKLV